MHKQNNLWYKLSVSETFEKKDQPLALRVPLSLLNVIGEISRHEDRPVGYVARELMIRGLGLYRQDGHLRDRASNTDGTPFTPHSTAPPNNFINGKDK